MSATTPRKVTFREIFAGRRGRLLAALLLSEFGVAVHGIAYSSVLPVASNDLGGASLYGATLVSGLFATLLVLAAGSSVMARLGPARILLLATALYVLGAGLAAGAVAMEMVLAGTVVRGLAGGMIAGLGLTALGALYENDLRPRVIGLFAIAWLVPSLAGPVLNAAVAVAFGWRVAMAWPAAIVVVGRALIGRHVHLIPWDHTASRGTKPAPTLLLLGGLAVAAAAPAPRDTPAVAMLAVGIVVAAAAGLQVLAAQVGSEWRRYLTAATMFGLCLAFFGGNGIVSLAAINGLGYGVAEGSVAVGLGIAAWALTGLRGADDDVRVDRTVVGLTALAVGLAGGALSVLGVFAGTPALLLLLAAWFLAGLGMGMAYRRVASDGVADLPPEKVFTAAIAVEFAEASGTAVGVILAGGTYSVGHVLGASEAHALAVAFALLAVVAAATGVLGVVRWRGRVAATMVTGRVPAGAQDGGGGPRAGR